MPAACYLPGDRDDLQDGLYAGFHDAPRQRRLAAFQRDPAAHLTGWRIATLIRALGADVTLLPDGRIQPRGFGDVVPFLTVQARRQRAALAAWLAMERDAPAELRQHARPPFGACEALREGLDFCAACGPPPAGAVAVFWAGPGSREWRCATCCPAPDDDDRVTFGYGCSGPDPAPAGRAPGGGEPAPRAEGADT